MDSSYGKQRSPPEVSSLLKRTRSVSQYIKEKSTATSCTSESFGSVNLNNILRGETIKIYSRMFFETLVIVAANVKTTQSPDLDSVYAAKVGRLYDIANVFQSMNLLEKIRHLENGKPAFRWLGVNGHPNTKSIALDTSNSKRRAFGIDITDYTDSKSYRMDSSSD